MMKSWIEVHESSSMLHAITRGYVEPVDAAAIAYLPSGGADEQTRLRKSLFAQKRPHALAIHRTPLGRIALIGVAREADAIYRERERLLDALAGCVDLAGRMGAQTVSLTGLLPSATGFGQALVERLPEGMPAITTGHATTVSAVALGLESALTTSGKMLQSETLGFVGLGSIGRATLRLVLDVLPTPARLVLCDVLSSERRLWALAEEISRTARVEVEVACTRSHCVADAIYESSVIVGATNLPDVLDVDRLRPGTILIDDSAPHCFDVARAQLRMQSKEDLTVREGGLLATPWPIAHELFLPRGVEAEDLIDGLLENQAFASDQIMGCVLSSVLSRPPLDLPLTVGDVSPKTAVDHFRELVRMGFGAAVPQCAEHRYGSA